MYSVWCVFIPCNPSFFYVHMAFASLLYFRAKLTGKLGTNAQESRQLQRQQGKKPSLPAEDYVQFCGGPTPDWERQGKEPGRADGERVGAKVSIFFIKVSHAVCPFLSSTEVMHMSRRADKDKWLGFEETLGSRQQSRHNRRAESNRVFDRTSSWIAECASQNAHRIPGVLPLAQRGHGCDM